MRRTRTRWVRKKTPSMEWGWRQVWLIKRDSGRKAMNPDDFVSTMQKVEAEERRTKPTLREILDTMQKKSLQIGFFGGEDERKKPPLQIGLNVREDESWATAGIIIEYKVYIFYRPINVNWNWPIGIIGVCKVEKTGVCKSNGLLGSDNGQVGWAQVNNFHLNVNDGWTLTRSQLCNKGRGENDGSGLFEGKEEAMVHSKKYLLTIDELISISLAISSENAGKDCICRTVVLFDNESVTIMELGYCSEFRMNATKKVPDEMFIGNIRLLCLVEAKYPESTGVKFMTPHDEKIKKLWGLSSYFILLETHLVDDRTLNLVSNLQEVNRAVNTSTIV